MKKLVAFATAAIMLLIIACSGTESVKKTAESEIAKKYAPENSVAMLRFSSIEKLFSTFGVGPDKILGEPVPEDRSEIIETLGFDPMNPAEYEKAGFDTKREFGLVLSNLKIDGEYGENTSADIDILFPVTQNSGAFNFIKERINSQKDEITVVTEENGILFVKHPDEEDVVLSIKADSDYLVFHLAVNSQTTAQTVFEKNSKLASAPNYKEIASSVDMGTDIGIYFDFKSFFSKNGEALQNLTVNPMFGESEMKSVEYLKYYRGAGASIDLGKSDLVVNMAAYMDAENPFKKMMENIKSDRSVVLGMEKDPAVLLSVMINASEYLNFLLETLPLESKQSFDQELENIKNQMGIDLKKEVIDQLAGSINFGMYDGSTINMMNYNTILNFNVKDPAAFTATLEKVGPMANMSKVDPAEAFSGIETGNITVFSINVQMMMAYIVIDGDNVSFCTTKDIASGAMNKKGKSFTEKLNADLKKKLADDQNYFYIDIDETYIAAKSIYQFVIGMSGGENVLDEKVDTMVKNFEYLYVGGTYKGEKAASELIFKTKFTKPFFIALQEEIAKIKK